MRTREEIVKEYKDPSHHIREILLDIRQLLQDEIKQREKAKKKVAKKLKNEKA